MAADRPAKNRVRQLWVERVEAAASDLDLSKGPLYLTLPGALGLEIEMLIQRGVIARNKVGAIDAADLNKIIAIESNGAAEVELLHRYTGLKVIRQRVEDLLRSTSPLTWPQGRDEWHCRARVVNLDLNASLTCFSNEGHLAFPVVQLVSKLADIHAKPPSLDWVLCLTLDARVTWEADVSLGIQQFLLENFGHEPTYATAARALLGDELYNAVASATPVDWSARPFIDQQRLLMALVPKKIAQLLYGKGWGVDTVANLHYGGTDEEAPMVTWVIELHRDARATSTPDLVYREGLQRVLQAVGRIEQDGSLS